MTDTFTEAGAERLADRIRAYWADKGFSPRVWIEGRELSFKPARGTRMISWIVRSDMANGSPQRMKELV